ncbi:MULTISPECIES: gephyrin-like molybdotransferase Glp [unclassified Polaromonas]|uniref:molybdopterin molybdotransferase MoeA n=1 Tax=unclassified Polaromonas TaxID=2638319 RepID=UPI000BD3889B|nr:MULTISPECIES: gephyrin-like molybdotransferase Glp [unclassified Polaromonas]OYY36993.1 MAG: molybdopterin molybdenumtransferase MoeA [Polaromonas sp. 35-63-35]OYZ20613.1 MAG: molybdopterin molybdenumtransferase MoeA [Polaromonas sp. 16-63-31]OYZ78752.1 MAG: molybdopterin molybdenumtransferase MoeA [Polaromonas sp. 24-63-21]OZA49735.1 MAG: molybdopterin molybdenumtransferase MoeA [Polaromonas sp. 17-63-33]OZA89095.1 MAG: molybdopterin molybdenumtransferase MoeA [Polaromonas sp. 39-63-25]
MKSIAQIAAELQGYDPQALSAADVLRFLSLLVEPVQDVVELPLFEALGRVLAADVVSPFDVPPHDNSAMDGYAFDGSQLASGTALTLKVVGTALAGKAWQGSVGTGECVKIMTGAIMPAGLDTVVPQEFVSVQADTVTLPAQLLQPGDNRRLRGEDLMQGRPALSKGELLTPARLGLVASLGLKSVTTRRALRVAYFSTGDEILSLGEAPREGAVYDSNRYTVFGMLTRLGCEVIDMGVVRDDPALLEAAFTRAAAQADAIITSGGVSVGEADYTKAMMKKLGDVAFWKIAMRPGRPMAVGRIPQEKSASSPMTAGASSFQNNSNPNGAILFGLPGNPVAVMVTFLAFVRPALLQMMGNTAPDAPLLKARSLEPMRKKPGRTEYQRGWVSTTADGSLQVRTTGNQGSGVLSSMAQANGLIVLHHAQGSVNVGEEVDVMMFEGVL